MGIDLSPAIQEDSGEAVGLFHTRSKKTKYGKGSLTTQVTLATKASLRHLGWRGLVESLQLQGLSAWEEKAILHRLEAIQAGVVEPGPMDQDLFDKALALLTPVIHRHLVETGAGGLGELLDVAVEVAFRLVGEKFRPSRSGLYGVEDAIFNPLGTKGSLVSQALSVVREIEATPYHDFSLDSPLGEEGETTFGDMVPADDPQGDIEEVARELVKYRQTSQATREILEGWLNDPEFSLERYHPIAVANAKAELGKIFWGSNA